MKRGLRAWFLLSATVACGSDPSPAVHGGGAGSAEGGRAGVAGFGSASTNGGQNGGQNAAHGGRPNGMSGRSDDSADAGAGAEENKGGHGHGRGGNNTSAASGSGGGGGDEDAGDGGDETHGGDAGGGGGFSVGGGTGAASGSGGTAGEVPVGEACSNEGATERCCTEGTRTCRHGAWSACEGAFISAESCNGRDDDCNGQVDELGTFSCGIGACAITVAACVDGALATCVPPEPATQIDGCNGIDDDCDGAVDEDCPSCVHVAPTGDDAAASASSGVTPFASVQAAIDFAASSASAIKRVCVAAGAACGAAFTYASAADAALTLRNGIDVLGGYEATTWTRCSDSKTSLAPEATTGVYFPPSIVARTVLDGFTLNVNGATVDGARNVILSHLFGPCGVYVWNGQAQITQSGVAVGAINSEVSLLDNCPGPLDAQGNCTAPCAPNQPGLIGLGIDASAGSRVEGNAICNGMEVSGGARGVVVRGNNSGAIQVGACEGAAPWFVANSVTGVDAPALTVSGDCRPVFEGNALRAASSSLENRAITSAQCSTGAGVPSGCVFTDNSIDQTEETVAEASNDGIAVGLACTGGSCTRIDHNRFLGLQSGVLTGGSRQVTGLSLDGGRVLVDGNQLPLGNPSPGLANVGCTGLYVSNATSRIQNNIAGGECLGRASSFQPLARSGGKAQIFSNYFAGTSAGTGVDIADEIRNNALSASDAGAAISSSLGLPAALDHNSITATNGASLGAFTVDSSNVQVNTIADLEALFAGAASGNLAVACGFVDGELPSGSACIDAGAVSGAPQFDFEGDRRDARPDIGPDEYAP